MRDHAAHVAAAQFAAPDDANLHADRMRGHFEEPVNQAEEAAWLEVHRHLQALDGADMGEEDTASIAESTLSGIDQVFWADDPAEQDTTAEAHAGGEDMQGIPWAEPDPARIRAQHRQQRLETYRSYYNLPAAIEARKDELEAEALRPNMACPHFQFYRNFSCVKSTIVHFQLRHLVWATSRWDVYVQCNSYVHHWNLCTRQRTQVMDCTSTRAYFPAANALYGDSNRPQISTMCVKHGMIAAGALSGEMWVQRATDASTLYNDRVTYNENGITNGLDVYETASGALRVLSSNNDGVLRSWEPNHAQPAKLLELPFPINYTVVNEDRGKLLAVVGDDPDAVLVDADSGKASHRLRGHCDYSFAAAWHPNGQMLATGNQDKTIRVWDVRYPSRSLALLQGCIGAVRSLKFSSDGRYLAAAESADFVHVYDVHKGFQDGQTIDLFGEISGMAFSPDADALFIGVADATYGSLLHFSRKHDDRFALRA